MRQDVFDRLKARFNANANDALYTDVVRRVWEMYRGVMSAPADCEYRKAVESELGGMAEAVAIMRNNHVISKLQADIIIRFIRDCIV